MSSTDSKPAKQKNGRLVYISDDEPGIRRLRAGKGFAYRRPDGKPVKDNVTLDRIRRLAVPPAYTDVWISPDAAGHIQATGRDDRGRKQYRYHPDWNAHRDSVKYKSLSRFAASLPKLRDRIDADLRRPGAPRDRVLASVVWLLDNAMIRVGNASYARDNKSFGLTTLKSKHVDITGSVLKFSFRGKSGKEWNVRLSDRRIARALKTIQDLPGQNLFQYIDDEGARRAITSHDVNAYIREAMGEDFSSKHFRTWGGTIAAAHYFREEDVPDSKAGQKRVANCVIDKVAKLLGNTRTVCRACYVHPAVFESWTAGKLDRELSNARKKVRRPKQLEDIEVTVARWLETKPA